ncbi:MAG TPA: metal ABC transporter substrate-binding protein [Anaerolineales bacterium]|nr:metal ABC transporter substrate-binding protein [Anaerolineales bacterium]
MRRLLSVWIFLILLLSACGGNAPSSGEADTALLTSTTFLADITRNIAGDRVTVESLLPIGADPHSYQPTPQDVAKIADSKLLIINGADYEHFIESLLENAGGERNVVEASAGISPRTDAESGYGVDPHMWLDPNNVIIYVKNIRDGLTHFDPESAAVYQSNADAYIAELKDLDAWIVEQVSQIPREKRLLVTNHEALGYFAERYGFTVTGTVVESFSSGASPSAGQMAGLIDQIKSSGAPAIFLDASDSETLAKQIADETGVRVVTDLHLESLTDGAPAATYIDMMRHNVTLIVEALK